MGGRAGVGQQLGRFHGKYDLIIGLKALGNYSAPHWSNKGLILLLLLLLLFRRQRFQKSMLSGLLNPNSPVLFLSLYQNASTNTGKFWDLMGHIIFENPFFFDMFGTCVHPTF